MDSLSSLSSYKETPPHFWLGRKDGFKKDRFYSRVSVSNLDTLEKNPSEFILLGFCADEGVRRNHGNPGASKGPSKIRENLRNLPVHFDEFLTLGDLGDVICEGSYLEEAQENLSQAVTHIRALKKIPFVLGGGHETAWGHFLGLQKNLKKETLGVINFDAHFDLRVCDRKSPASSGTPFYQAAKFCKAKGKNFHYMPIGIQNFSNTKLLFEKARELEAHTIKFEEFETQKSALLKEKVKVFCSKVDKIYLSICLDVFSSSYAPGVSAPNPFGLNPREVLPLFEEILKTKKVVGLDIVELSPEHDENGKTAKLAAFIVNFLIHKYYDLQTKL